MHNMIEGFNRKINELKQKCSKMFKTNVKLKRKIRSKSTNFTSKKRRKYKSSALRHEKYTTFIRFTVFQTVLFTVYFILFRFSDHRTLRLCRLRRRTCTT